MTEQPSILATAASFIEVDVDGVRRPGTLHSVWRRGGHDICEVSWRVRPGVKRINTLSAERVWVVPRT
jgi:hypothetical protein